MMRFSTPSRPSPKAILLYLATLPLAAAAKCGSVDYSLGAEALSDMHDYVVTMMLYVVYVLYAVGSVVCVVSALQIYVKMSFGEPGVLKSIMTLFGAVFFLIGATIFMPALFGYQIY